MTYAIAHLRPVAISFCLGVAFVGCGADGSSAPTDEVTDPPTASGRDHRSDDPSSKGDNASGSASEQDPAPPGVGLIHTEAQLQFMWDHRGEEPWASGYAQVMSQAEAALGRVPQPIYDFRVPAAYSNPQGHEAVKKALADDGYAAYAAALGYQLADTPEKRAAYAAKAVEIVNAWGLVNKDVGDADGSLVMMYKGIHLLYAGDLMANWPGWDETSKALVAVWVGTQFRSSSEEKKYAKNNHGAWGTYGALAAAAYLHDDAAIDQEIQRTRDRIRDSIDAQGELPEENLRTNSGIWYTYFALAPITGCAQIAKNLRGDDLFHYVAPNGRSLRMALDRLFFYSQHPDRWPYKPPRGIAGRLWRLAYPCTDELDMPTPTAWPGNLYEAMSDVYGVEEWKAWVAPVRPVWGGHVWLFPTLTRETP